MATVTVRYGGDTVTHAVTAVHISSTDLPKNTNTGYDAPTAPSAGSTLAPFRFSMQMARSPNGSA